MTIWALFRIQIKIKTMREVCSESIKRDRVPSESSLSAGPAEATFVPHTHSKSGTTNLPEGTVHVFRDGHSKPTLEELESKVAEMSLTEGIDDNSDGIMLGVLAVPSWMTPSDFLTFVAPAVDSIGHLRIIRCVLIFGFALQLSHLSMQRFCAEPFYGRHQISESSRCSRICGGL